MARRNSFPAESKSQSKPSRQKASELWASPSALSNSRALIAAAFAFGSASLGVITAYCQSPNNAYVSAKPEYARAYFESSSTASLKYARATFKPSAVRLFQKQR